MTKPDAPAECPPAALQDDAGTDTDIARRLKRNPADTDAQLDCGLDESMDASDPPSVARPGDSGEPMPSSGFDPDAEDAHRLSR